MRRPWPLESTSAYACLKVGAATVLATVLLAAVAWAQDGSNFGNTCDVSHHSRQDPIFEPVVRWPTLSVSPVSAFVTSGDVAPKKMWSCPSTGSKMGSCSL